MFLRPPQAPRGLSAEVRPLDTEGGGGRESAFAKAFQGPIPRHWGFKGTMAARRRGEATRGRRGPRPGPLLPGRKVFAGFSHAAGTAGGDDPLRPVYGPAGEQSHAGVVSQVSGRRPITPPRRLAELEKDIQSTGFFRNKAKNIQAACRMLVEQCGGQVPQEMDQLVRLPGVGRKTANVVLGTAFRYRARDGRRHSRGPAQPAAGAIAGEESRENRAGPDGDDSPRRSGSRSAIG